MTSETIDAFWNECESDLTTYTNQFNNIYYFQVLTNLHLTQIFWPEHALHAATHLNVLSAITPAIN